MGLFRVGKDFNPLKTNPFRGDQAYGPDWIFFRLVDSTDSFHRSGGGKDGIFQIHISKGYTGWEYSAFDCIQYETEYSKNIILAMEDEDFQHASTVYAGHSYKDPFLRSHERRVLVHGTAAECYASIVAANALESWNRLKQQGKTSEEQPIGSLLGDPASYSDYIMFGGGGYRSEIVVASKQKGRLDMDEDQLYRPGVRLYFDAAKIASDGLLVRDGLHRKVKDRLPLTPYLLCAVTPACLGISGETTPMEYAAKADAYFYSQTGIRL